MVGFHPIRLLVASIQFIFILVFFVLLVFMSFITRLLIRQWLVFAVTSTSEPFSSAEFLLVLLMVLIVALVWQDLRLLRFFSW